MIAAQKSPLFRSRKIERDGMNEYAIREALYPLIRVPRPSLRKSEITMFEYDPRFSACILSSRPPFLHPFSGGVSDFIRFDVGFAKVGFNSSRNFSASAFCLALQFLSGFFHPACCFLEGTFTFQEFHGIYLGKQKMVVGSSYPRGANSSCNSSSLTFPLFTFSASAAGWRVAAFPALIHLHPQVVAPLSSGPQQQW